MAVYIATIAGVEHNVRLAGFSLRETQNEVDALMCDVEDAGGSPLARPQIHDPIILTEDGVKRFAGYVTSAREHGEGGYPNLPRLDDPTKTQILTRVIANDYWSVLKRRYVTETIGAGVTLKAFLQTLIADYYGIYGITLHPSQADGPTLEEREIDHVLGNEVVAALTGETGWVAEIDADQQLRMYAPGTLLASFDWDEDDVPAKTYGDLEVERTLHDEYANRVIVICEPVTQLDRVDTWVGDGVTHTFPLTYQMFGHRGYVVRDFPTSEFETLAVPPDTDLAEWRYVVATNSITRYIEGSVGTLSPPPLNSDIRMTYDGTFSAEAVADYVPDQTDPNIGLWEFVLRPKGVESAAAAQQLADEELARRRLASETSVTYWTEGIGLRPGRVQAISSASRNVSGDFLIISVLTTFRPDDNVMVRQVTASQSQKLVNLFQQTYREWNEIGGAANPPELSEHSSGLPAPPLRSLQFNDVAFGGAKALLYDKANGILEVVDPNDPTTKITRIRTKSSGDFEVLTAVGSIQLNSAEDVQVTTASVDSNAISLGSLTAMYGLALHVTTITSLPATIDALSSDIGATYLINSASGTLTLPDLSSFRVRPFSVDLYRVLLIKNIHATGIDTLDGAGTDTIDGALTLDLGPNQATILHGSAAGWRVIVPPISTSPSSVLTLLTADPASPANDTWWFKRTGAGPYDISLNVRIAGATWPFNIGSTE